MKLKALIDKAQRQKGEGAEGGPEGQSCEPGHIKIAEPWKPLNKLAQQRIEIMVTGDLSRIDSIRRSIRDLQDKLFKERGPGGLEMRITAFLDDCTHRTPWSSSPINVAAATSRWHCFQGQTRFAEALDFSADEVTHSGGFIDQIIIIGDRCDDNVRTLLQRVEALRQQGTKIYTLHVGGRAESLQTYENMAKLTGGVCLALASNTDVATVIPVLMDYLKRGDEVLLGITDKSAPPLRLLASKLEQNKP